MSFLTTLTEHFGLPSVFEDLLILNNISALMLSLLLVSCTSTQTWRKIYLKQLYPLFSYWPVVSYCACILIIVSKNFIYASILTPSWSSWILCHVFTMLTVRSILRNNHAKCQVSPIKDKYNISLHKRREASKHLAKREANKNYW